MSAASTPLLDRARSITRLDFRPHERRPSLGRVALACAVAVVGSLLADAVLVAIGRAVFSHTAHFGPFGASAWTSLTVIGVVAACIGWALLVRMTSEPRWFLLRAAVVVTVVLLVPDVLLLSNNPTGPVLTLMVMHVAIAVVTCVALLTVAPAGSSGRPLASGHRAGHDEEVA